MAQTPTHRDSMRAVKQALDPNDILNRGRFLLLSFATPTVEHAVSNFSPGEKPTWELYSKCVHCGLCLDQCPTYRALGTEMDSPRGRIYQMLQVDAGRLALGDSFVTHIDRCLGCLNCQTACPSGRAVRKPAGK